MSGRKIILDYPSFRPPPQSACPHCGTTLSSPNRGPLLPVAHNLYRCAPGQHPRLFETRCGGCGRILIVEKTEAGITPAPGDQAGLVRQIRELDRQPSPRGRRGDHDT